ncbi:MAG: cytochrome P450 [Myxococcota bacterium]|jgi:cholest-4-en-3-one 26-monooxygenase|nr:cytochrome P450 [Myxococcota bacterium]
MSGTGAGFDSFDLVNPKDYADQGYPHQIWDWLRANDPVHWYEGSGGDPFWVITKHADITAIGKLPEQFISGPLLVQSHVPIPKERMEFPPTLIQLDPPKHGVYRRLISKRFTPRALQRFHHDIEGIGKEIVDDLLARGGEGECDFVDAVSAPLPIAVIAWMLGLPKEDWNLLFDWTNRIIGAQDPAFRAEGKTSDETAQETMIELFTYFTELAEEKRKNPADDLISLFTQMEVDGEKLPHMDIMTWCLIIVIAGNETTRNATTGGMLAFIENQEELRKVQAEEALLPSAVEEIVRWTAPIIHFARTATEDFELRGKTIQAGQSVALFYPSANRDEDVFEAPGEFRITRNPNRHLGFGVGEHFCLGAHLARLEMEVAYKYLLPRIEEVELAGPVDRLHSSLVGGIKHLPIRYKLREA